FASKKRSGGHAPLRAADPICCRQGGPALSGAGEEVKIALEIGDNFAIIKIDRSILMVVNSIDKHGVRW
ncbi:MAG TPA: hypothetical protein PKI81_12665, partial [bacterium]|nr:hypothetical protein [bacterium]